MVRFFFNKLRTNVKINTRQFFNIGIYMHLRNQRRQRESNSYRLTPTQSPKPYRLAIRKCQMVSSCCYDLRESVIFIFLYSLQLVVLRQMVSSYCYILREIVIFMLYSNLKFGTFMSIKAEDTITA